MRKKYAILLFSIMLVLLLGACGKTESQKEKSTECKWRKPAVTFAEQNG